MANSRSEIMTLNLGEWNGISATSNRYVAIPFHGQRRIIIEGFVGSIFRGSTSRWDLILNGRDRDGNVTELGRRIGTSDPIGKYLTDFVPINKALDPSFNFLLFQANLVSGTATAIAAGTLHYRVE